MTYLALARKWRPRTFAEVAGQEHVVRALCNSLASGRVHHAFLLTGTRGVGKTTLARIFVKALNCESGVTAEPCGRCGACTAIDAGRFVDFFEIDAASHTGVDDARELLDNAQYSPAGGRYKVYLIDEVHMLSKAAFNALLKTLEEPPPHVKFLLATTDPQKIPVTVLSRCLQFNLKRLPANLIQERLASICAKEGIKADSGGLARIARAAAGSLRDGLSLLDQAIAFGNGAIHEGEVARMLGSVDRGQVTEILRAVAAGDARAALTLIESWDELAPDYSDALAEIAAALQRVAVLQLTGDAGLSEDASLPKIAGTLSPEIVQLMYQIAILARRDLPLAPDPRLGFEMAVLRLMAFQPDTVEPISAAPPASQAIVQRPGSPPGSGAARQPAAKKPLADALAPPDTPAKADGGSPEELITDWPVFAETLGIEGAARQLAANSALAFQSPFELRLAVDRRNAHLLTDSLKTRLASALQERLGPVRVGFEVRDQADETTAETAAARKARETAEDAQRVREAITTDSHVRELQELFGGRVVPESVRRLSADTRSKK